MSFSKAEKLRRWNFFEKRIEFFKYDLNQEPIPKLLPSEPADPRESDMQTEMEKVRASRWHKHWDAILKDAEEYEDLNLSFFQEILPTMSDEQLIKLMHWEIRNACGWFIFNDKKSKKNQKRKKILIGIFSECKKRFLKKENEKKMYHIIQDIYFCCQLFHVDWRNVFSDLWSIDKKELDSINFMNEFFKGRRVDYEVSASFLKNTLAWEILYFVEVIEQYRGTIDGREFSDPWAVEKMSISQSFLEASRELIAQIPVPLQAVELFKQRLAALKARNERGEQENDPDAGRLNWLFEKCEAILYRSGHSEQNQ